MKIIARNDGEMVLKDGNTSGIILGVVFIVAGIGLGIYFWSSIPMMAWIGAALAVIGLASIVFSTSITVDINKANGQLAYQKKRLIGGSSMMYAIADVLRIETRKEWRAQNNTTSRGISMPRQVLVSQSVIVFKNGQEVPLDHQKSSSGMSVGGVMMAGEGNEVALATEVANFMGVPFQEIAPPAGGIGINL